MDYINNAFIGCCIYYWWNFFPRLIKSDKEETHNHDWTVEGNIKESSCENDGLVSYICKCGEKKTEIIYSQGHQFSEWTLEKSATCFEQGKKSRECSVCGEKKVQSIKCNEHHYEAVNVEATEDVQYTTYKCELCEDTFILEGTDYNVNYLTHSAEFLLACPSDFNFDIICTEDEKYIRDHLKIVNVYFDGSEQENSEIALCDYNVLCVGDDVWRISPKDKFSEGNTYRVKRFGNLVFSEYGTQNLTFSVEKPETQNIVLNKNVIFLQNLEDVKPGYYPYKKYYSQGSGRYWLKLGNIDGLKENDLICVGSARSFEDVLEDDDTDSMFAKIVSIQNDSESNGYWLELTCPEFENLFESLDIYTKKSEITLSDKAIETIEVQALKSLYESEEFIKFLAATYENTQNYISQTESTSSVKSIKQFIDKIKINPPTITSSDIDNGIRQKINISIIGEADIPVTTAKGKVGSIKISFSANMEICWDFTTVINLKEKEWSLPWEELSYNNFLQRIYFQFSIEQTITNRLTFNMLVDASDNEDLDLTQSVKKYMDGDNLDDIIAEIKNKHKIYQTMEIPVKKK